MNKIWEYMGREFPFDITSEECRRTVSDGFEELSRDIEDNTGICESVRCFFDKVFGGGAGCAICGDSDSAEAHISAYISFVGFMCAQADDFSRIREELAVRA